MTIENFPHWPCTMIVPPVVRDPEVHEVTHYLFKEMTLTAGHVTTVLLSDWSR